MRKILILFSLLAVYNGYAQKKIIDNQFPDKYLMAYIEPAAAGDFFNGHSFRGGVEYGINEQWALSCTAGSYFQHGYIIKGEIKRYFRQKGIVRPFLALEYRNLWHMFTTCDYVRKQEAAEEYVADKSQPVSYDIERIVNQVSVKYGKTVFLRNNWVFEWYAGMGIRFKSAHTTQDQTNLYYYNQSIRTVLSYTKGEGIWPGVLLGVKLGKRLF